MGEKKKTKLKERIIKWLNRLNIRHLCQRTKNMANIKIYNTLHSNVSIHCIFYIHRHLPTHQKC